MYSVVNMDGYKKDDILSQALDLVKKKTNDYGSITSQSTYLYHLY